MKILLATIIALLITINLVKAEEVTAPIKIRSAYAGIVGVGFVDTSNNFVNVSDAMVAVTVQAKLSQDLSVNVNLTNFDFHKTVGHYFLQLGSERETWMMRLGQTGKLTSLHRPHPTSPGMHFEPASKSIIPGASIGGATWFNYNTGSLVAGLFRVKDQVGNDLIEYHGSLIQNLGDLNLRLTGSHSQVANELVFTGKYQGNELTLYNRHDSLISTFVNISSSSWGWKIGDIYLDQIYDSQAGRFNRLEIGWYKGFDVNLAGAEANLCLCFGWREYPERSFRLYVWTYLFRREV
jgi:hypothetical protein